MRYSSSAICAVALLGLLAVVVVPANAQSKMPRVGILLTGSPSSGAHSLELDAFMKHLAELGWVDGKNLVVDQRWAEQADPPPRPVARGPCSWWRVHARSRTGTSSQSSA
ncbi:MAG TPA: hypothetical protein VGT00_20100 [Methylomirabilota bacterium]|jgi:hypothetical protein|nr:hypothetical protein [Methylomirabilota bacterium]